MNETETETVAVSLSGRLVTAQDRCDRGRMGLWMSWTLEGVGSAGQMVADIAAAVRALNSSVERSRRAFGSDEQEWWKLRDAADAVGARP